MSGVDRSARNSVSAFRAKLRWKWLTTVYEMDPNRSRGSGRCDSKATIPTENFVTISGCSGGGKSTLLAELRRRGFVTIAEPGRRIVVEELNSGGRALPWLDAIAFARRAIEMSLADRAAAAEAGARWVFFDRGLIDATTALQHLTGETVIDELRHAHRYNRHVFLTPPWPEIYEMDQERRHGFTKAVEEYDRLREVYPLLGYEISILPKIGVEGRADLILATLHADDLG
jgi:predicted ATPase